MISLKANLHLSFTQACRYICCQAVSLIKLRVIRRQNLIPEDPWLCILNYLIHWTIERNLFGFPVVLRRLLVLPLRVLDRYLVTGDIIGTRTKVVNFASAVSFCWVVTVLWLVDLRLIEVNSEPIASRRAVCEEAGL